MTDQELEAFLDDVESDRTESLADVQPLRDASLDELDQELFRDVYLPAAVSAAVLAENQRTPFDQMASLRMVHSGPPAVPTVLGMLVLGKEPTRHLPMAYVSFLRLAGTELSSEVVSNHDIRGPLPRLLSQIDELVGLHIMTAVDITSADREIRRPDYPLVALQQLLRNGVMHRLYEGTNAPLRVYWYADRVEIISPGGPFGQVTPENFGQPGVNDYRNPHVAEAMRVLGYAQHFGVGIQIARDALVRNGNAPLEFRADLRTVVATVRRAAGTNH